MKRTLILLYGAAIYGFFFITFCYVMGWVNNLVVPHSMESGEQGPLWLALLVNVGFLTAFAVQHTIMARPGFKAWWTRIIPAPMERPTFVLIATAILALMMWQWRPIEGVIWNVEAPALRALLHGISLAGFGIVLFSSFLIDHFDLFGVRQVVLAFRNRPYTHHPFMERSLYKMVRHPLMLGFLIAFWSTPTMTMGHLLFAAVTTGYIIFGVAIEERDLVKHHGNDYLEYRRRTPAVIPFAKGLRRPAVAAVDAA